MCAQLTAQRSSSQIVQHICWKISYRQCRQFESFFLLFERIKKSQLSLQSPQQTLIRLSMFLAAANRSAVDVHQKRKRYCRRSAFGRAVFLFSVRVFLSRSVFPLGWCYLNRWLFTYHVRRNEHCCKNFNAYISLTNTHKKEICYTQSRSAKLHPFFKIIVYSASQSKKRTTFFSNQEVKIIVPSDENNCKR